MITRDDIIMRTIVDLPQEQIRKLALLCRREKISRAEAVRRAVDRFLRGSSAGDLGAFFGASKTHENISRHISNLRGEWRRRKPARRDSAKSARLSS
jgi:metal-responsive CopG/Arc/MetJ family transcriptional regulator